MRKLLLLLLASVIPALAVTCTNSGTDAAAIQSAVNGGGTVTLSGTCALGSTSINVANPVTITGTATLNYTGSGYIFTVPSDNVSIVGVSAGSHLILNGGGIVTTNSNANTPQANGIYQYLTLQNITNGSGGIEAAGYWNNFRIDSNNFNTISTVPVGSITPQTTVDSAYGCTYGGGCNGLGIDNENGMNASQITNNTFDVILGDAIRVAYGYCLGTSNTYHTCANNVISYNTGTRLHRMGIETQSASGSCPGGCTGFNRVSNPQIKGNYFQFIAPYGNTYGISYPMAATVTTIINNTSALTVTGSNGATGYCLEGGNLDELNQGNVCTVNSAVTTSYGVYNISGENPSGHPITQQNNRMMGPLQGGGAYYGTEGGSTHFIINQYNITVSACPTPTSCGTSTLATSYISGDNQAFPSRGNGTWTFYATNQISVKWVQFFLDGSPTAIVTQEIQDVNTNFTSDAKWDYHATFDTTPLTNGSHTLVATATDVSGATSSQTQHFTVGSGSSPIASFSPTSLTFGSFNISTSSPTQTIVLMNTGSATMNISATAATGDYSRTTTCGATLAASASCNLVVTFTPTTGGTRTGSVTVTDDAAGSPQSVPLTGTGVSPGSCGGSILLDCDFSSGVGPWLYAQGNATTTFTVDSVAFGVPAGHIHATTVPFPLAGNIEMYQGSLTIPANGTNMTLTFRACASRAQQINVLGIQDGGSFTSFGLAQFVNLTASCATYGPYNFTVSNNPGANAARVTWQADNMQSGDDISYTDMNLQTASGSAIAQVTPSSINYGATLLSTPKVRTITVTNIGTATLTFSSIVVGGTNAGDFGQANTCGSSLATGVSCTITSTFTPSALGTRAGTITISDNDSASPQIVSLTGFSSIVVIGSSGYISHSTVQLTLNTSTTINAARSRSTILPTVCTGGSGGLVQPMEISTTVGALSTVIMDITGLTAGTSWNVCPEVSTDNGVTYSTGVGMSISTQALPAVHPAIPISPATFDTSYPDTTAFAIDTTITSSCLDADIGAAYTNAVARQLTQGTVIKIPAGAVCSAKNYEFEALPPDVQTWTPSNVNTTTSVITLGGTPALNIGDRVVFALKYASGSAYPASTSCEFSNGLVSGQVYYVATVMAGNMVTLACNANNSPGTVMTFTTQGTASSSNFYWAPYPRNLFPIIFRSATPDSQLPPAGTAITPAWLSKMATFRDPLSNFGANVAGNQFMIFGDTDGNVETMPANIRIGPGIEITTVDAPESHTSSDPLSWFNLIKTPPDSSGIIFDRTYPHGLGTPWRGTNLFFWDGSNNGFVNNWVQNWTYFHSQYSGLAVSMTSSHVATMTSGIHNVGAGPISVAGRVITFSGTASGIVYVGLDMQNANAFTLWLPAGETATCTGGSCATSTATFSGDGSCFNSGDWEKDGSGQVSVGIISCIMLSSGSIGTITAADPSISTAGSTEGCSCMIGGLGPGPYVAIGNHFSGAGLMWHIDDSGGTVHIRGDYTYLRNYWLTPLNYMYGSTQSDGLIYRQRQQLEWKSGRRTNFSGNIMDGEWTEVTGASVFLATTSVNGEGITDFDMRNNTFMHGPGVTNTAGLTAGGGSNLTPPALRFRFQNNLAWDIGNPYYWVQGDGTNAPNGWAFEGPSYNEDVIINSNTFVGNNGRSPSCFWNFDANTEGMAVTNNIFYVDPSYQCVAADGSVPSNVCTSLVGKAFADCKFTPSYLWANNLMIGNGQTPSAVATAWPTLPNYFQSGSSSLFTVGWSNYAAPILANGNPTNLDYCLMYSSPWKAGASGVNDHSIDVGANCNELNAAQGLVKLNGMGVIASTSAVVNYFAPDSQVCYVLYSSTNDISTTSQLADAGGARARNTSITGLTTQTVYYGWVSCLGNAEMSQKSFSFKTH